MLVRFGKTFYILRSSVNANLNLEILWYECFRSSQSSSSKHLDEMKTKPFSDTDGNIWVSPPHPKSNLRLKVFPYSEGMADEEKEFYKIYEETQDWNQEYWEAHNDDFKESKKHYVAEVSKEKNLPKDAMLTDEDMSQFYQDFLQKNHKKHIAYNWNWYKKNFNLLYLAAKMNVCKVKRFFTN